MATPNLLTLTAMTQKLLVAELISNVIGAVYTVPANHSCVVKQGYLANTDSSDHLVSLGVELAVDAGTHTTLLLNSFTLAAGDSLSLRDYFDNMQLGDGDVIFAGADNAGVVTLVLSGVEGS